MKPHVLWTRVSLQPTKRGEIQVYVQNKKGADARLGHGLMRIFQETPARRCFKGLGIKQTAICLRAPLSFTRAWRTGGSVL